MSKQKLVWKKKPEAEDYEGALNFLLLIYPDARARRLLRLFRKAKTVEHAAKDLLRGSGLPLLSREDPHVEQDLTRIHRGKALPPVLLVRGDKRADSLPGGKRVRQGATGIAFSQFKSFSSLPICCVQPIVAIAVHCSSCITSLVMISRVPPLGVADISTMVVEVYGGMPGTKSTALV